MTISPLNQSQKHLKKNTNDEAYKILEDYYGKKFNDGRKKMAKMPETLN